LSQSITSLANKVGLPGRRRAEQRESPEEYARAYGGSAIHFRTGGSIVRGPH
jgi:hypothetical protein